MKPLKKLTALLVVLSLLCTLWVPMAVSAETAAPIAVDEAPAAVSDPVDAAAELLAALDNGDTLCAVYRIIIDAIRNGEEYVSFGDRYALTETEKNILVSAVDATIPEIYHGNAGHSYATIYENTFYSWFYDWGISAPQFDALASRVAEMTADLTGKSDFDKCRILYERLINTNVYDFSLYDQTAYGALVEGTSVCAGYGRTYQLLLQTVGIPCLYVTGTADNGFDVGGHAWNLVKLDGYWYYCDPTWDDLDDPFHGIPYTYFNIPYTQISTDHFLDEVYELWLPKETAPAADFYTASGLVVETVTLDQLITLFKKHNPLSLRVLGDSEANFDAIVDVFYGNLDVIAAALGAPSAGGSCGATGDYSIITLSLALDHDHDYRQQIIEPTCTDYGTTEYACQTCGDRGFHLMDPLGHDCGEAWEITDTYHTQYCLRCGIAENYGEHTYEKDGVHCDVCGYANPDAVQKGDADGNGKVNNRDLGLLLRYLNSFAVTIDKTAVDMDGNGTINNRDVGLLQTLLNE